MEHITSAVKELGGELVKRTDYLWEVHFKGIALTDREYLVIYIIAPIKEGDPYLVSDMGYVTVSLNRRFPSLVNPMIIQRAVPEERVLDAIKYVLEKAVEAKDILSS